LELKLPWAEVKATIPQIGDKKKLLDLAEKNLQYYILQKKKQDLQKANKKTPTERILEQMKKDLQLEGLPLHLECFDNSNLQGTNPVSAMVVFRNAKPAKRDYRHYHVKTVEGPNDFASMEEVVERRYRRLLDEKQPLPQLIIIDGGKGQLSAAMNALERLGLHDKIAVIGIAKRLEEIYFPGDSTPLLLSKKSPTLKVIQQARDEAHRFGLSFHRNLRSKDLLQTQLTEIKGVGKGSAEKLLSHFGSVKKLSQADLEQISAVVGKRIAQLVFDHFGQASTQENSPIPDDLPS
jgi:excinuclease ABC subunit C